MKTTAFTLDKEEAVAALLEYASNNDLKIDIDKELTVIQQDDGTIDCVQDMNS